MKILWTKNNYDNAIVKNIFDLNKTSKFVVFSLYITVNLLTFYARIFIGRFIPHSSTEPASTALWAERASTKFMKPYRSPGTTATLLILPNLKIKTIHSIKINIYIVNHIYVCMT